jgi:hypothetical protein
MSEVLEKKNEELTEELTKNNMMLANEELKSAETIQLLKFDNEMLRKQLAELGKERDRFLSIISCYDSKRDAIIRTLGLKDPKNVMNFSPILRRAPGNSQVDLISLNSTAFLYNEDNSLNNSAAANSQLANQNDLTNVTFFFSEQASALPREYFGYIEWKVEDELHIIENFNSKRK